jgi:hypothetical protein
MWIPINKSCSFLHKWATNEPQIIPITLVVVTHGYLLPIWLDKVGNFTFGKALGQGHDPNKLGFPRLLPHAGPYFDKCPYFDPIFTLHLKNWHNLAMSQHLFWERKGCLFWEHCTS